MSRGRTACEQLLHTGPHPVCRNPTASAPPVINSPACIVSCIVSTESCYLFAPWFVPGRAPLSGSLVTPWAVKGGGLTVVHGCVICSLVRKDRGSKGEEGKREGGSGERTAGLSSLQVCKK